MPLPEIETTLDEAALAALLASGAGWAREGEELTKTFRRKGWKDAIAFVILITVIVARPTGLLGERVAERT